jgi:hypothetical protein
MNDDDRYPVSALMFIAFLCFCTGFFVATMFCAK